MHDVAIVGAGAVGLLLACLLAQRGIDVVVLERRSGPGDRTRAIGIHPPGLRALDAAGVGDEVRRLGVPIVDGVVTCEGHELGRLAFDDEPVWSLPQRETETLLETRLARLAPGALRRGVEVTGLAEHDHHVDLRTPEEMPVRARYVVGADGVRSAVRSLADLEWMSRRGSAEYVMGDADDTTDAPATALLRFEPAGVVESFPLPGGRRRWVAWVRRTPAPLTPAALATIVAARTGASVDLSTATEPSPFSARQHLADRFATGRVALVGDAAHEVSPIGGQGMNLGWLDAVRLDAEVARALAAGAPANPFGRYGRARRAAALRATRQAAFNMAMGAPAAGARLALRNRLVRVLAVWPLRALLASAFTMRRL
ncbi:FAD-dependent oxidoreductase [Agromyces aerolatus]|uniref:FAD-dependent oxidoreductase n=1 Tax=Agromyces sp. LY-1074 TaxID=3074080 RepID=UPI00286346B4|nr:MULTISPECIES: NAD(P)/FAD-dependent oxidoreductase [unclassified Agromyces]MDR5701094.1 NAD(P)/FAD-dependent oxidoreductase [Agromyces sp. LY-1074]MDR5707734.1 NAD(P)/FAD-dependent oxidoreductase [Agromyces sp. LY-1358]